MRYYIILTCIILIIIYFFVNNDNDNVNPSLSYYRFNSNVETNEPSIKIIEPFNTLFKSFKIKESNNYIKSNILFFHLLTDYEIMHTRLMKLKTPKYIYSLKSIDILANKATLHSILSLNKKSHYKYTPLTYLLNNKNDFTRLLHEFDDDNLYILKKNLQRQKGCTITNNINFVKNAIKEKYVVCQELLQNPFLISGHKINIRVYLLVVVKKKCKFSIYKDGFMYYTPKKFIKNSIDKDRHITTGYIDRKIYEENPLTLKDLYSYLGSSSQLLRTNITDLFKYVAKCYEPIIIKNDANQHLNFCILGCDIAVDNNLGCKIMEINKGPDLTYKDERDKRVKYNLVKDTLHNIGLIHSPNNNFIDLN